MKLDITTILDSDSLFMMAKNIRKLDHNHGRLNELYGALCEIMYGGDTAALERDALRIEGQWSASIFELQADSLYRMHEKVLGKLFRNHIEEKFSTGEYNGDFIRFTFKEQKVYHHYDGPSTYMVLRHDTTCAADAAPSKIAAIRAKRVDDVSMEELAELHAWKETCERVSAYIDDVLRRIDEKSPGMFS